MRVRPSVTLSGWKEKREREREKCTKRLTAAAKESRPFLQNECDYCGRPSGRGIEAFKANTKSLSELSGQTNLNPYFRE